MTATLMAGIRRSAAVWFTFQGNHCGRLVKNLLSIFLLTCTLAWPAFAADAEVKDAVTAEKIAAEALKAKIGDYNFSNYMRDLAWQATVRDDYWFAMPVLPTNIGEDLMEQNGWMVQIDRRNGRVLSVFLQF